MAKRVEIIRSQQVFDDVFKIDAAQLRYERQNGMMSAEVRRLNFNRGDSVAVVLHDALTDTVIFTEQFRYPAQTKGQGWVLELPAGSVEPDEVDDPMKTLRRELLEEIGYSVQRFHKISTFFVSPGGTSERIHLYYAAIMPSDHVAAGGGVASEGEDVRTVVMDTQAALDKITTGEIMDAKTIIGLQWLQINKDKLPDVAAK